MDRLESMAGFKPTPHPVLKLPGTAEEARAMIERMGGPDAFCEWLRQREELIQLEKADPFNWGCQLPQWKDADALLQQAKRLLILGGNRSSKTTYGARSVIRCMRDKPGARVLCFQETEKTSIALQQLPVQEFLPREWRGQKKTEVTNLSYSLKGGFTENTFVAPNRSQCWFMNYSQNVNVLEGWEADLVWCDELVPWAWVETLGFRLVTRGGRMVLTFTPKHGYTMTVKQICEKARVTRWRDAALLADTVNVPHGPPGQMPYVMEPLNPHWRVIFFHSDMNPFGGYEELVKEIHGKDRAHIMIRAYGYTEKTVGDVFPLFGAHNVIEPDRVPAEGTNYKIVDPAGDRNWFILWVRVDAFGRHYVYREWPDAGQYGEWAVASEDNAHPDGVRGPAQRSVGYGIADYKKLFLKLEGIEICLENIMDPRTGRAQSQADEGGTCLLNRMAEEQFDRQGNLIGPAIPFIAGSGIDVDDKVGRINDLLSYDPDKPFEPLVNEPLLYVSNACQNTIWALQNWTGRDRQKGACKDPIDCLGLMAAGDLKFADEAALVCTGGGAYG